MPLVNDITGKPFLLPGEMSRRDFEGGPGEPSYEPNFISAPLDADALHDVKCRLSAWLREAYGTVIGRPYFVAQQGGRLALYLEEPADADAFRYNDLTGVFTYQASDFNDHVALHRRGLVPGPVSPCAEDVLRRLLRGPQ